MLRSFSMFNFKNFKIESTLDIRLIGASENLLLNRISLISKGLNIISPIGAVIISTKNMYFISNFPYIESQYRE